MNLRHHSGTHTLLHAPLRILALASVFDPVFAFASMAQLSTLQFIQNLRWVPSFVIIASISCLLSPLDR